MLLAVERGVCLALGAGVAAGVAAGEPPGHLAPVFGAVTRQLEVDHASALRLLLFLVCALSVAAAVRLGIIGPLDGQRLQWHLAPLADRFKRRCKELRALDAAQTAPLLDILHGAHDRLYSRLFHT